MSFGMIMRRQKMKKKQSSVIWVRTLHCFIVYINTDDIYKDIVENVKTRFDTSNYELERTLPKGKNKTVIGLMKDELGREIMTKFVGFRAKTYTFLIDGGNEDKKSQRYKRSVLKRESKFENYKSCLGAIQLENKVNHVEKKED